MKRRSKPAPAPKREPEPHLLITIDERHRRLATAEVRSLLDRAAPGGYRLTKAPGTGFLGARLTHDDPRACIARLHSILSQDPLAFQHTHRWIPVEAWAKPGKRELQRIALHANAEIAPDESWAIRVERHGSRIERDALVHELAAEIPNPNVELEQPDKTLLIEAIGNRIGMAVVTPEQTLSVDQQVRAEFVRFEET